jgi:hypothetical protein
MRNQVALLFPSTAGPPVPFSETFFDSFKLLATYQAETDSDTERAEFVAQWICTDVRPVILGRWWPEAVLRIRTQAKVNEFTDHVSVWNFVLVERLRPLMRHVMFVEHDFQFTTPETESKLRPDIHIKVGDEMDSFFVDCRVTRKKGSSSSSKGYSPF